MNDTIQKNTKSEQSNWKFDKNIVSIFDDHVKKSVPLYDEIHNQIADISCWFVEDNTNIYDIGTSTGKVIHNLIKKHPNRNIQYIGIDSSKDMVVKAKTSFHRENVTILNSDIVSSACLLSNSCFIASVLTLQFISQKDRQSVINKVYQGLNKGGGFVLVEKVVGNSAKFDEMWIELYHELKLNNGLSESEVFAKSRAIRGVLRPNTVEENIKMLEDAGFKDIDSFFKWNNFVGFLAIK